MKLNAEEKIFKSQKSYLLTKQVCSNRHDNSSEDDFEFHCSVPFTLMKKMQIFRNC